MGSTLDRFKKDMERLEHEGQLLEYAMLHERNEVEFSKAATAQLGDAADGFLKKLPNFRERYQAWYSEALALLTQILPDRVQNFRVLYEKPKNRKEIDFENYVIQDFLQGLRVTRAGETIVDTSAAIPQFRQQLAILKATRARFESSLFELRHLLQADLFDDEIESAKELSTKGFFRAAGAVARRGPRKASEAGVR